MEGGFINLVIEVYQDEAPIRFFLNIMGGLFTIGLLGAFNVWGKTNFLNNLSSSVPQFLISVGILGTFYGIFIGLIEFNAAKINESILNLIDGLKLAFITSIMGIGSAIVLRIVRQVVPKKQEEKEEVTAEDIHYQLLELINAINSDSDTSLSSQIQKMRLETNDNLNNLNKSFTEFTEKMTENNTKSLIEAIEQVMKDFNTKINEQIGDNFKRLNEGVEKLVVWQDNYKNQMAEMIEHFTTASKGIETAKNNLAEIADKMENLPKAAEDMKILIETTQIQINDLGDKMSAFVEMKEKATNVMPDIEKKISEMSDNVSNLVTQMVTNLNTSSEKLQENVQKQLQDMQTSSNTFNDFLKEAIRESTDNLNGQIKKLDEAMQEELSRAMKLMSDRLVSLSNKFVEDYTPLTERLKQIVNISRSSSSKPKSDN
jgi:chromosome segregation ATPase